MNFDRSTRLYNLYPAFTGYIDDDDQKWVSRHGSNSAGTT